MWMRHWSGTTVFPGAKRLIASVDVSESSKALQVAVLASAQETDPLCHSTQAVRV